VEAMVPVTARAATASAAILVLIDIGNSIRLKAVRCGPHGQLDGASSNPVRSRPGERPGRVDFLIIAVG
jgi:hypothetical protein